MTAVYEKHGLRFMYPENWKLTDGQEVDLPYQVTVETPAGGIWSVNIFPEDVSTDELLEEAIAGLHETYDDVELSETTSDFEGFVTKGVEAFFYCLDFVVTAKIQVIETPKYKLVFLFQAENRDFDTQHEVFRAIATSLLQSL